MIRAPPVCALTAQIASICISNVELQQFFTPESRPNSFVVPNFTAKIFVEPDGSGKWWCYNREGCESGSVPASTHMGNPRWNNKPCVTFDAQLLLP